MTELVTDALDTSTLLKTLIAFKDGDFSVRLPVDQTGIAGKIADTLNDIFKLNERMASEFARISSAVRMSPAMAASLKPVSGISRISLA